MRAYVCVVLAFPDVVRKYQNNYDNYCYFICSPIFFFNVLLSLIILFLCFISILLLTKCTNNRNIHFSVYVFICNYIIYIQ